MTGRSFVRLILIGLALVAGAPSAGWAQSTIAGIVTDTSGAVVPGVTVEASSPALIEKVRSATSDAQGRYSIIDLRPGIYTVTFSLTGFATFKREAIDVLSNVNVPINAQMKVGGLEETLTVSGASPMVDVQSAARVETLSRTLLETLPTSRTYTTAGVVVLGVKLNKPDIGGTQTVQQAYLIGRGMTSNSENGNMVDGLNVRLNGSSSQAYTNYAMAGEVSYSTSAGTADSSAGGVRINMIPRDGGNTFHGEVFVGGSSGKWQSSNLSESLKTRGLRAPTAMDYLYDANPNVGGPIRKDRVWFLGSARRLVLRGKPGAFYKDGTPGIEQQFINSYSGRITMQLTPKNKLVLYMDRAQKGLPRDFTNTVNGISEVSQSGVDPATATDFRAPRLYYLSYAKWTATMTSRLLLETGATLVYNNFSTYDQPGIFAPPGSPNYYTQTPKIDIIKGTLTDAPGYIPGTNDQEANGLASSVTYATGSHTLKTGFQFRFGLVGQTQNAGNGELYQRFRNGAPDSVDVFNTPVKAYAYLHGELGVYAQDTWTIKRLTVNPGARWDYLNASAKATSAGAGRFVPARNYDGVIPNLPTFSDISPRLSAAYDLFGDAKTAVKVSASKYMFQNTTDIASPYNPMNPAKDRRNWSDCAYIKGTSLCDPALSGLPTNGDRIVQDNEIGPSGNANFGISTGRRPDPNLKRQNTWEYSAAVQHQLIPLLSVNAGWYHRKFYNVQGSFNTLVNPVTDYTAFQTTNPLTGESMTIFNLNRDKLGVVDIVDRNSDINSRVYNSYEASFTARLPHGGSALGGWTMERSVVVACDTVEPNQFRYCDQTGKTHQELGPNAPIPFRHQFKLAVASPLPWKMQGSMSFLSFPGEPLTVTWSPAASVFPGGQRTSAISVPLIPGGTKYLDRWNQFDFGVAKKVHLAGADWQGQVELFNVFNSAAVLSQITAFGSTLDQPTSTLQGRLVRLSMLVKF